MFSKRNILTGNDKPYVNEHGFIYDNTTYDCCMVVTVEIAFIWSKKYYICFNGENMSIRLFECLNYYINEIHMLKATNYSEYVLTDSDLLSNLTDYLKYALEDDFNYKIVEKVSIHRHELKKCKNFNVQ